METIIRKTKIHCIGLLLRSRCGSLPFHNVGHTVEVYENVLKIGMYGGRNLEDLEPVLLAALFHDTGYTTVFKGHEDMSVIEANHFLAANKYPVPQTVSVIGCINATKMPQQPKMPLENIICDADLFHLGTGSFWKKNNMLRTELAKFQGLNYSISDWNTLNIKFLENHRFCTSYGVDILEPVKQEHLKELKSNREKIQHP
ncbi:HD domain-containing protein [Pricia antarctica]|uniref:HD domain-containing protein n=1 Tax=Pricia antarctica TaxID=641691 RepID=A0A1G7C4I0_9FLAO|nr:HD domain-containing protein [Pricia antarctica]SDE33680.1 HD domain-containing protein [Pricia antarctica]